MSRTLFILCLLASVALASASSHVSLKKPHHPKGHHHHAPKAAPSSVNLTVFADNCYEPKPLQVIPAVSGGCYWIPYFNVSIEWTLEDPDDQNYFLMLYNSPNCNKSTGVVGWGDYGTSCFTEMGYPIGVTQAITQPYAYTLYSDMTCDPKGGQGVLNTFGIVPGTCWDGGWEQSPDLELYNTLVVDPITGQYNYTFWNDSQCTEFNFAYQGLVGECFQQWKIFDASVGLPQQLPHGHTHVHQSQKSRKPTWRQIGPHAHKKHHNRHRTGRHLAKSSEELVAPPAPLAPPVVKMTFFAGNSCDGTVGATYSVPPGVCTSLPLLTQSVLYTVTDPSTEAYEVTFYSMFNCQTPYQNMTTWQAQGDGCFEEAEVAVQITQF